MFGEALNNLMRGKGHLAGRYTTSQYFTRFIDTNGIGAGARIDYTLNTGSEALYLPFNEIIVTNLSNSRLNIRLDDWVKVVPANSVISLPQQFRHIAVTNASTVANNDIIELQFRRKADLTDIILALLRGD